MTARSLPPSIATPPSAYAPPASTLPAYACPTCGAELRSPSGSTLACAAGHGWPVVRGLPRFVPSDSYAAAFGAQWLRYRTTQLDSYTGVPMTRDRAARCLGPALIAALAAGRDRGAPLTVLEVGCGAGRFTEVLLAMGAAVHSVDLSAAVEANAVTCPPSAVHGIAQADVRQLPFRPGQFDVVVCLGVVQHTPDPEATIAALYAHVRPSGWLVIDHYAPAPGWWLSLKPIYRAVGKRLPAGSALAWTERMVDLFFPLHERLRDDGAPSRGRRLLASLLARVSPVCYDGALPFPAAGRREWALLDTHDALTDWYKHRRTPAQLTAAVRALGAVDVWCVPGGNGVELRCRRPVGAA